MAKKVSKAKPKAQYAWVFAPTADASDKVRITAQFQPLIDELKSRLSPLEDPQTRNQCVDIETKWRGNFFSIIQKYKCPNDGMSYLEGFDAPLARLEFYGKDKFNLSAHHHSGKCMPLPMYNDISTEEAIEAIKNDDWFGF
jgi:hypothetical protein